MSGWFIGTLIVLFVAVIAALVARGSNDSETATLAKAVTVLATVVTVVGLLISSIVQVPTRSVGVAVAFGRPDAQPLGNGLHLTAPWKTVEKFDASVQTLKLDEAKGREGDKTDHGGCVTVRLANQTTACVDVSVQWNIDPSGDVVELYRRYKTFDNVEANLVQRQLVHALNTAFAAYDPLASINGGDKPTVTLDDLAAKASKTLADAVGSGIKVSNLTIPLVHFDGTTQDKLNAYAQALADTRIAEQRKKTATAQKEANDALAAGSNSTNPGVLYQNCLDMVERLAKEGKGLPAAFSCGAPPATVVPVK